MEPVGGGLESTPILVIEVEVRVARMLLKEHGRLFVVLDERVVEAAVYNVGTSRSRIEDLAKGCVVGYGVKDVPPKHGYVVVGRKSRQDSVQLGSSDQELKIVLEHTDALISTLTREFENGKMGQSTPNGRDRVCDRRKPLHVQAHLLALTLKLNPTISTAI
jgi:hypothetical protein